jgi:hypothetical protein
MSDLQQHGRQQGEKEPRNELETWRGTEAIAFMRWNSYCRRVVDAAVSLEYMIVELFDIQDLASSPSHREASRVHIAKRSRGFGRRRDNAPESSFSTLFYTVSGINRADSPDRCGPAAPENLEMAISLPERRLREKGHGSNSFGRHLFFTLRWSDAPSPSASMAGEEVRK